MPRSDVPDRWTNYQPFLSVIKGTRFLPIKVPLKEALCRKADPEFKFTPDDFLELCQQKSLKVGLIIDLTFTQRYYDRSAFESRGISYEKIATYGHHIPDPSITRQFKSVVERFIKQSDSDALIVVHCTHGVNRTGYVLCHYMQTQLSMSAEDAISRFSEARGYPIERQNYLESLRNLSQGEKSSHADEEDWIPVRNNRQLGPWPSRGHHWGQRESGWRTPYSRYHPPGPDRRGADSSDWRRPSNEPYRRMQARDGNFNRHWRDRESERSYKH